MNFRRIVANAVARRIAVVLVASALAWLGLSSPASAAIQGCTNSAPYCDEGQAYAQCNAKLSSVPPPTAPNYETYRQCERSSNQYTAVRRFVQVSTNSEKNEMHGRFYFQSARTCANRPDYVGSPPMSTVSGVPRPGSMTCMDGCVTSWYPNGDGTFTGSASGGALCTNESVKEGCPGVEGFGWNAYMGACEPKETFCSADQIKNAKTGQCEDACPVGMVLGADGTCSTERGECPAGNVKAPSGACLPGDGQCAAGEARRENGTCGKDSDGDGQADEDDDNPDNDPDKESASGGDDCNAPPSCSGGAIDCMQVKIQWRIDCNTRRNRNVSGGTCAAMPVCTGEKCDAMEYAQLLQQWRATCHLEKLANSGLPGGGTGSGSNAMDPVSSDGVLGDDLDPSTVQRGFGGSWNGEGEELAFDESGYGFARTCPTPPTIDVLGKSITFDTSVFCDWMRLGGVFVMIMAYLAGLSIVVRS